MRVSRTVVGALVTLLTGCIGETGGPPRLGVAYDDGSQRIVVTYGRDLESTETLHARLRRGSVDELDCRRDAPSIDRIDGEPIVGYGRPAWLGPMADQSMFQSIYDTAWLEGEPTPEMIQEALLGGYVIDACLMDGDRLVAGESFDIRRALDQSGENGKFDGDSGERIASTEAYADVCVHELGEIPFFEKLGDGDYGTYNCLDSTPIPTVVTGADGQPTRPEQQVSVCDDPQYIYSLCEPNAVSGRTNGPRVATRSNDQGTHWVLLCRKAQQGEGAYNDIAMVGHNPYSGKTCFFQNALYSRTDGLHVPHPGDKTASDRSQQVSATLWQGIHGGLGSGIECALCHSADPLIHSPWIDGALDQNGDPVVPKMGVDDDFVLGYNDAPYSLVNRAGQGWTMPQQLVSPEAAACTRCHRIPVQERWMGSWINRLVGEDSSWTSITTSAHQAFDKAFWMPPDLDGLEASTWAESDFGKAVRFIQSCNSNPSSCQFAPLPTDPISEEGSLPEIDLTGRELAIEALKVFGADFQDPGCPNGSCRSRRCAECHSVSRGGLMRWRQLTDDGLRNCDLDKNPADLSQSVAKHAVDCMRVDPSDERSVFEAAKLGVLATGVQYTTFRRLFQVAYGEGWLMPYAQFKARVGMPKGSHPKLSQKEYATILKWFHSGLANLDDVLAEAPAPTTCSESVGSSALSSHVANMRLEGWGAKNAENGIRMHGCAPGTTDATTCLANSPDRTSTWGGSGGGRIRELAHLTFRTSFWARSSADGRYVGNGGAPSSEYCAGGDLSKYCSTILDLSTGRKIAVAASYDPGFFPDNSGFIYQGTVGGAGLCAQTVLASDDLIDFSEPQCMTARGINLYQHVARGVGGGDYFVINSQFTSDSGQAADDPSAYFNASSTMKFTPMIFNGTRYEPMQAVIVDSPFEGDSVLSPSSQLVASRLAGAEGRSLGYVIRRVTATRFGSSYAINVDQKLGTVCLSGAKPNFSFDERFIVTHHYSGGKADILLVDLLSGDRMQVTNMPSGTYAQFPHFRSDGWIYFLVTNGEDEWMAASDAALRL